MAADGKFDKHVLIGQRLPPDGSGMSTERWAGLNISHGVAVHRYPVVDPSGQVRGFVLGWLMGEEGVVSSGSKIDCDAGNGLEWADRLCGRYVVLVHHEGGIRLFPDACGLMGIVYARQDGSAASVPNLLTDDPADTGRLSIFDATRGFGWYPFGLTTHVNIQRLLPNFSLDLVTFEVERFFPDEGTFAGVGSDEDMITEVFGEVVANLRRISTAADFVAHLTAGRDSRMALSAMLAAGLAPRLMTIAIPSQGSQLDCNVARRLAASCRLEHEIRPFLPPRPEDRAQWLERVGWCVSDYVTNLATTWKSWKPFEVQLGGACGEIGRAFYWSGSDVDGGRPDAAELLRRMGGPVTDTTLEAAERWLATVPDLPADRIWDLAYVEQRLGCWAGASVYGSTLRYPSLSPFNSRRIVSSLLALSAEMRLENRFANAFIRRGRPELLRIPFNRPSGLDLLRYPRLAVKTLVPFAVKDRIKRRLSR